MTSLLLLGGNNSTNQKRIKTIETQLKPFFDETYIHEYQHWTNGEKNMNIEKELKLVHQKTKDNTDIVIFAKSLGTVLTMKLIVDQGYMPKKCIFVGIPLGYIYTQGFPIKEYVSKITCPIMIIQHTKDPAGSYQEIVKEINKMSNNFSLQEIPGNDHTYEEVEKLTEKIERFIK